MVMLAYARQFWIPLAVLAVTGCFDPSEPGAGSGSTDGSTSEGATAGSTSPSASGTTVSSTTLDPDTASTTGSTDTTTSSTASTDPGDTSTTADTSPETGDTSTETTDAEGSSSSSGGPAGVLLFEDTFERPNSPDLGTSEYPGGDWTETTVIGPGEMSILDGELVGLGVGITAHDDELDCATLRFRAVARLGTVGTEDLENLLIKYDQNGATTGGGYGIVIDTSNGTDGNFIGIQPSHIGLPPPGPLSQTPANNVLSANIDYYLELITTGSDAVLTVREESYGGTVLATVNTGEAPEPTGNLNNVFVRISRTDGAPSATTVGEISLRCED